MIKLQSILFLVFIGMGGIYKFIDHTADIAAEITADNYEDLMLAAVSAWKEAAIDSSISDTVESKEINITESSIEELLVEFLSELNFLLLTKNWVFEKVKKISVEKVENLWKLYAVITGSTFNIHKHIIKVEIKAVTFHQMDIKYIEGKYSTRIIFDI